MGENDCRGHGKDAVGMVAIFNFTPALALLAVASLLASSNLGVRLGSLRVALLFLQPHVHGQQSVSHRNFKLLCLFNFIRSTWTIQEFLLGCDGCGEM